MLKIFSPNVVVFLSFLVCVASRANKGQNLGYLFVNGSRTPYCFDLKANDFCPPSVVDYKILGYDRGEEIANFELQSVKLSLQSLGFYPSVSQVCRESVREYSCSNMFAVCTPESKYGLSLKYDFVRTEAACESIKSNCPQRAYESITYNCSLIQKDVTGYTYCLNLPEVPGDVCSKSKYKYPAALGEFYKVTANVFPRTLAALVKGKFFTNTTCEQEFVDIYCQLMRGSICSTDMTLRMYATSQQDCASTYTKCISSNIPAKIKDFFVEICKLFPDANTAKRVPLPSVAISNSISNE